MSTYNVDHTGANTKLGGFQLGLVKAAYHSPGENREPTQPAASETPSQNIRPKKDLTICKCSYENQMGFQQITGWVVSCEHPIVRVETNGLIRITSRSSNFFIEAIKRNPAEELDALEVEKEILPKS